MQNDDENKLDDDLIDDLDFEDFDDEEFDADADFADEDLDVDSEFEDDFGDEVLDEESDVPVSKKKKSFLKSKAGLGIVAAAVLGGGAFVFLNLGGAPAPQRPIAANNQPVQQSVAGKEDVSSAEMPPMPVPTDAEASMDTEKSPFERELEVDAPDDFDDSDLALSSDSLDDGGLTPMPSFEDDVSADDGELAPLSGLDGAELDVPDLPEVDDDFDVAGVDSQDEFDLPDLSGEDDPADIEELQDAPSELRDIPEMPMASEGVDISALEAELADIGEERDSLRADNEAKERAVEQAQEEINVLQGTVSDLEEKIARLERSLAKAEEKAEVAAKRGGESDGSASARSSEPVSKAASTQANTQTKSAVEKSFTPVVDADKWVLRSAQPGRAVISEKTTGDFRTVEVGDTVPGLGRVQSVGVEDGRWVVRGSAGAVYQ